MKKMLLLLIAATLSNSLSAVIVKPILTSDSRGKIIPFSQSPNQDGPWNENSPAQAGSGQMDEAERQQIQADITAAAHQRIAEYGSEEATAKRQKQIAINNTPWLERYTNNTISTIQCGLGIVPAFIVDAATCSAYHAALATPNALNHAHLKSIMPGKNHSCVQRTSKIIKHRNSKKESAAYAKYAALCPCTANARCILAH